MAPVAATQPRLTPAATQAALDALRQLLGDRFSAAQAVRDQHGRDESWAMPSPPDAVVFPHSTEEVVEVVKICAAHGLPIIPYGAGTSLEGHVTAVQGGVSIDLMQMNRILQVNAEDLDVVVQPGVRRKQLNEYLRDTGLFFPIDPGADASIGGMVSTRASGTNAVRYGTMRENVLALTVVMSDGRVIRTSKRAKKSAAGYDLTRLFIGSEGTLGIITEITVKLYGIPEAMAAATCSFASLEGAVNTVIQTIQAGIPVARIELLDDVQARAINEYSKLSLPVQNMLMLEFHGSEAGVAEQAEMVQGIASEHGGEGFQWATRAEDRARMWEARHAAAYACKALRKGCEIMATDVCVPISRLTECILETKEDVVKTGLTAPLVGHVGDGNFHLSVVVDRSNPQEVATVEEFSERLVHRALRMEGTCTGEHGIGRGKMKYLTAEHGEAVAVMRAIKKALDPDNLMNPGKIFSI
jgi:D-lactate dehydrogenase (cytochrome)